MTSKTVAKRKPRKYRWQCRICYHINRSPAGEGWCDNCGSDHNAHYVDSVTGSCIPRRVDLTTVTVAPSAKPSTAIVPYVAPVTTICLPMPAWTMDTTVVDAEILTEPAPIGTPVIVIGRDLSIPQLPCIRDVEYIHSFSLSATEREMLQAMRYKVIFEQGCYQSQNQPRPKFDPTWRPPNYKEQSHVRPERP